ncbi:Inhibitor of growth protein 1 [Sciurus carolinensis]|uniref:Inhibitor of growth protein 1 n=1 Tax=Sciurus carolinensis TaxID=30640 RepID=A0AA41NEC9_SCICA|nr:Inhibitor of growth protein 1 [Sciurus carolinensis]
MLNSANRKQIHLVNYVEDYLTSINSLPLHLKRNVSEMQEIERALIWSQKLCYEKIQILSQIMELAESQNRQVDHHVEVLETPQENKDTTGNSCNAGQEKAKNKTIAQAEKMNYKHTLWPLNNVNQVMNISNNNHDHDDITSGTPKEKNAKTSKNRLHSQGTEESKP